MLFTSFEISVHGAIYKYARALSPLFQEDVKIVDHFVAERVDNGLDTSIVMQKIVFTK